MAIALAPKPQYIHRRPAKLYYNVKALGASEDLLLDANGAPDQTQNPNAVYLGASDGGFTFEGTPTFYEEEIDESLTPIEDGIDALAAQVTFDALEVLDLQRMAALFPYLSYSSNTVSSVVCKRIKCGTDSRTIITPVPVVVISKDKYGGYVYVLMYAAYAASPHQMQFQKTNRSKQNFVIKALSDPTRADGDRVYREGYVSNITITNGGTLTAGTHDVAYAGVTLAATGGTGSYTWALVSGTLPTGLTLNAATGAITGTPTVAGTYNPVISATDSAGNSFQKTFTIVIA